MGKLLVLTLTAGTLCAQTWTDMGSGTLFSSACVANAGGGTCGSSGACTSSNYAFTGQCAQRLDAWNGAVLDTFWNRLLQCCGGHGDYYGNEIGAIDIINRTIANLYQPSCFNYSGSGSSPCAATSTNSSALVDGSPSSRHTYNQIAYVERYKAMYMVNGTVPGGTNPATTWKLNLTNASVSAADWTAKAPRTLTGIAWNIGNCDDDTVLDRLWCAGGSSNPDILSWYNYGTDTWTAINGGNAVPGATPPGGATAIIDNSRSWMIFAGNGNDTHVPFSPGLGYIKLDGSDSYTYHNMTSTAAGTCDTLINDENPGMAMDPHDNMLVGKTAISGTVIILNPSTWQCTTESASGGPANYSTGHGVFGRWRYSSTLSGFVTLNAYNQNAFLYQRVIDYIPPTITTPASAGAITPGTQNSAYTYTFVASGTAPITWAITSGVPPTGVSLDSSSGVLSGTPITYGTFNFTIRASGYQSPDSQADSLVIAPICLITSTTLPSGKFNTPYSQTVPTQGCTSPTFAKTSGTLPTGLTLHTGTGVIDGTPTASGLFSFAIGVTDAAGNPSQATGITIIPGPGVYGWGLTVPGLVYR